MDSRAFPMLLRFTVSSADHQMNDEQCPSCPLIIRFQSEGQSGFIHFLFGKEIVSKDDCRNGQRELVSKHNLFIIGASLGKFPGASLLAESRGSPGFEFGSLPTVPSPISSCTPGTALQDPLISSLASKASVWFSSPTALQLPGALFPAPWKNTNFSKVTGQPNTKK